MNEHTHFTVVVVVQDTDDGAVVTLSTLPLIPKSLTEVEKKQLIKFSLALQSMGVWYDLTEKLAEQQKKTFKMQQREEI